MSLYADVILPLPVPGMFTYQVADREKSRVRPGMRITVQFGRRKIYTAVIRRLHEVKPAAYEVKAILSLLDDEPVVNERQFLLWEWISEYYMCTLGEVYKAALPSGLKLESETRVMALEVTAEIPDLNDGEALLWKVIILHPGIRVSELQKSSDKADITPVIKSLMDRNLIVLEEKITQKRQPKKSKPAKDPDAENLKLALLSPAQQKAIDEIRSAFLHTDVALLHGITSSGKTEIYIHLIREAIQQGKQVLYLLPEIALTAQIITRLRSAFGQEVAVYHSRFTDRERVATWKKLLQPDVHTGIRIVLGARSAVFLPFREAGLVIIDEEHENTYKQFDPAPRYHARDTAIMLARFHGAKVLLGTATPSVETYFNCLNGKYSLIELTDRYRDMQLPDIHIVNTRELKRKKRMQSHFSPQLLDNIAEALKNKEQIILFQNRRGFSLFLECAQCGEIPRCRHCDVSLTYHKLSNRLTCHYCGYGIPVPKVCQSCGSPELKMQGFGTEKIEEEISIFFPEARVARMDLDSTRKRQSFEKLIASFEMQESDILVGTQMVSKGLDFDHVKLVGIVNADTMLNYPDFRAHERSFQLMAQVAGRAGRKTNRGMVIIQTSDDKNPVIRQVVQNDFTGMYQSQLEERKKFQYPPFCRLLEITLKHRDRETLDKASDFLAQRLKLTITDTILGPEYPLVSRIQNMNLKTLLIKIGRGRSLPIVKKGILFAINELTEHPMFRTVITVIDVDPC
jgi:primosomal protein N' (replication factor Y) (superfamily II helicase)